MGKYGPTAPGWTWNNACGGCGELPLVTCQCDMPKGAVEEKNFIRERLAEGLSVEQIIGLLDKKYGHRV